MILKIAILITDEFYLKTIKHIWLGIRTEFLMIFEMAITLLMPACTIYVCEMAVL